MVFNYTHSDDVTIVTSHITINYFTYLHVKADNTDIPSASDLFYIHVFVSNKIIWAIITTFLSLKKNLIAGSSKWAICESMVSIDWRISLSSKYTLLDKLSRINTSFGERILLSVESFWIHVKENIEFAKWQRWITNLWEKFQNHIEKSLEQRQNRYS